MMSELQQSINAFAIAVNEHMIQQGFWDNNPSNARKLMLIVTEVAEACEADRKNDKENFGEELADIIIRTVDLAHHRGIDIGGELVKKHQINLERPRKHGKEY